MTEVQVQDFKPNSDEYAQMVGNVDAKTKDISTQFSSLSFFNKLSPIGFAIEILLIVLGLIYISVNLWAPKNDTTTTVLQWMYITLLSIILILLTILAFGRTDYDSRGSRFWSNIALLLVFLGSIALLIIYVTKNNVHMMYNYTYVLLAIIIGVFIGLNGTTSLKTYTDAPEFITVDTAPFYINLFFIFSFLSILGGIIIVEFPSLLDWGKSLSGIITGFSIAVITGLVLFIRSDRQRFGDRTATPQ